jgi:hypothetical protein
MQRNFDADKYVLLPHFLNKTAISTLVMFSDLEYHLTPRRGRLIPHQSASAEIHKKKRLKARGAPTGPSNATTIKRSAHGGSGRNNGRKVE